MYPNWTCAILSLLVCANALSEDQIEGFISLTKFDYEEYCTTTAESEWVFIKNPTNHTRRLWESAACKYALYKIKQVNETSAVTNETFKDTSLAYAYNVVIKPGDALLRSEEFHMLVSFSSQAEMSRLIGYYTTGTEKHFRQDVERQLARNRSPEDHQASWSAWHRTLASQAANFSQNLQLARKAAIANENDSVGKYWEMLSGFDNGYQHAKNEWDKIRYLKNKFDKFVKRRLSKKYNAFTEDDALPAHLLGSLQGYDWTNLAMDVIPHNNVTYGIIKNMWEKEIVGETLYKEASRMGQMILTRVPQANFWNESDFHGKCPSHLVNLCHGGKMRISTCSEASIGNYITAHKNVAKILVNQESQDTDPILTTANRYSALEEGIAELFGALSVSQAWLSSRGLISNTTSYDEAQIVTLMITALDVLPRMAYYLAADTWRIDTIENKTHEPNDLASTWWKYRMEYEGIGTNLPDVPTFLDDDYITSNRPYLSKFLGTILGFQIYEYIMGSTEVRTERIEPTTIETRQQLMKMISYDFGDNWKEVIRKDLDIWDISADSLLSYLSMLETYIDDDDQLNDNFLILNDQEKELEVLQDNYRKKLNEPVTTTTTPTTTTTATTVTTITTTTTATASPIREKTEPLPAEMEPPKSSISENATNPKNIEIPPVNETKEIPIQTKTIQLDETVDSSEKPKAATNKAVWAVAAVLIATVIICIIAIFGRRRCKKTPKNRRYV